MAILYKANETDFNHLGLGPLDDAVSILVTEERNGMFELEMGYPIEGTRINEIKLDRLIKADAGHNLKGQRFKIIRITKPIDGIVTVNAEHISYLTQDLALKPVVNYSGTASQALNTWNNNLVDESPFIVASDITTTGNGSWSIKEVKNAREALGGVSGSILEKYGGEYRFDNYSIRLMAQRGVNSGALIAYGRNLVDLTQEESIADTFTSVYPYAIYQDAKNKEQLLTLPEYFVDSEYVGNYARRKILPVDFSEDEIKDVTTLISRTNSYIKSNGIGIPKVNMQIKYIDLAKTLDYKDLAVLEEINLCDNVFIYFEQLDVNTSAKIIKTVWDDLLEQYDSIEVGEAKSSLSNSINATVDGKLETIVNQVNTIQLTADGLNVIYRGSEEPAPGNIGDLWYEPDGIYENMYQWDGSIWKLMLSTRDLDSVSEEVKIHTDEIASVTQSANDAVAKADQLIIDAGFIRLEVAQVKSDALTTTNTAQSAYNNAISALSKADTAISTTESFSLLINDLEQSVIFKADSSRVDTISGKVDSQGLLIQANADALIYKADKTSVDTIKQTVNQHTNDISINAQAINARLTSTQVDSLVAAKNYVNTTTLAATASSLSSQITQVEVSKVGIVENMTGGGKVFKNPVSDSRGPVTGVLIINTPITSAYMTKLSISGYNYAGDTSNIDLEISFYAYTPTQFLNYSYVNKGNFPIDSVRIARNTAGRAVVIIGTGYTSWQYPKIQVTEALIGHGSPPDSFKDGWSIAYSTTLPSLTAVTTVTGPDYNVKISSIEQTVNGIQTTVASKADNTQITQLSTQISTKVESSTYNSKMTQLDSSINLRVQSGEVTAAILADKKLLDTRNDNQLPAWYDSKYPRMSINEFKLRTVLGLPGSSMFVQLTTKSPWSGSSGGEIVQVAESPDGTYQRSSSGALAAWGAWDKVAETGKLISQINLSTEGILLQGKRIQLDGDVTMTTAFATKIKAIDLIADRITSGTLNAATVNIVNMNASNIISGAMSASRITTGILLSSNGKSSINLVTGDFQLFGDFTRDFSGGTASYRAVTESYDGALRSRSINKTANGVTQYNAERYMILSDKNLTTQRNVHSGSADYKNARFIDFYAGETLTGHVTGQGMHIYSGQNLLMESAFNIDIKTPGGNFLTYRGGGLTIESDGSMLSLRKTTPFTPSQGSVIYFESSDYNKQGILGIPSDGRHMHVGTYFGEFIFLRSRTETRVVSEDAGTYRPIRASNFYTSSSREYKTNIVFSALNGLEILKSLNVVEYDLKSDLARGISNRQIGFISEDSPAIASSDNKSIDMYKLNAINTKAIKELSEKVRVLEYKIEQLESVA